MNPRTWFHDNGIHIFPSKNKIPSVPEGTSQFEYRCTREQAARFKEYGVPGGLLAFADSDSLGAESWLAANLPDTPFKVTSGPYHDGAPGRGRHRYYRLVGDAPHFIHRGGHTIEFRHLGQYVIGPGSVRPDGVVYTADKWSWNILDIPIFPVADFLWDDRPLDQRGSTEGGVPLVLPPIIHAGERHDLMFKLMRSLQARGVTDIEVLLRVLRAENQIKCSPPINDTELERYIRRVSKYRDRPGFERDDQDAEEMVGGLLEAGVSVQAIVTISPALALDAQADLADIDSLPSQPSQPFFHAKEVVAIPEPASERPADIATGHIAKASLLCRMCGHGWLQKRSAPPKRCPRCRSTLWNRGEILTPDDDDGLETLEPDDDNDLETIEDDDDEDIETIEEEDEDVEFIDEDE